MKKLSVIVILLLLLTVTANATEIPRESVADYLSEDCVIISERLISDVLTEVKQGLGYADAKAKCNRILFDAWLNGKTDGYSFGDLTVIANNAIFLYRDMYLHPEVYAQNDIFVKLLINDIIIAFSSGDITYREAVKLSYERILQTADKSFGFEKNCVGDSCYWNVPSIDTSQFTTARKLLLESMKHPPDDGCFYCICK